ncbi:hypothetical protein QE450_004312 [Paenibacillus sp. SORGH_AS306]|uniref:hypothetical protein n=1 Tax=unclassified Paenibacillus TaxID=185978 RepID=UPI0027862E7B|nr:MULTISPECIES: hypothetical protein [unclassified Paenibacillus]MDQ1236814.1 hypothetical protein [Paenibacillus sp. SORGH_AS_0306]MDR6109175.1 hypothetical protein [Paenibacillus sp. SORGH_AS_0338]
MIRNSVSIYKNKKNNKIFIVPSGFLENGIRTMINKPIILGEHYNAEILGESLKKGYDIISNQEFQKEDIGVLVVNEVTGIKSFSSFSKQYFCVSSGYDSMNGYDFYSLIRGKDGSYMYPANPFIELSPDADYISIGEAIIKAFESCE